MNATDQDINQTELDSLFMKGFSLNILKNILLFFWLVTNYVTNGHAYKTGAKYSVIMC